MLSIDSAGQNIVLGLVIILAVFMDVVRAGMEAKNRRMAAAAKQEAEEKEKVAK